MSWLYSQALVEVFSEDTSSDGEQSAPLSGSLTQQAYCAPDKMTDFSRLSRFGMTFKPLTDIPGEELLTLYLEVFHAKTSAQQEREQELTESAAECGEKWHASFARYDPDLSLWKTHQCSLLGDSEEFLETWPQWGLMRDGECWEQRTLEQTIRGTGYGLSPDNVSAFHTPNTTGLDGGSNSRKALKKRLLPTPDANCGTRGTELEWNTKRESGQKAQLSLNQAIKMWPTPQASDNRDRGNMSNPCIQRRVAIGKQIMLSQSVDPISGQLNPTWVEWLMGWPLGWTDLKPLEMDKSPSVQLPPGGC